MGTATFDLEERSHYRKPSGGFQSWLTVVIVLVTWAISAGVNYGIVSARIEAMDRRIAALEQNSDRFINRREYIGNREDMAQRLDRIERKIDSLDRSAYK